MNKIETAIKETKKIIEEATKNKHYYEDKILTSLDFLFILQKIQADNTIPNEENQVSETFLNSKS
jgi:hypothetical protein